MRSQEQLSQVTCLASIGFKGCSVVFGNSASYPAIPEAKGTPTVPLCPPLHLPPPPPHTHTHCLQLLRRLLQRDRGSASKCHLAENRDSKRFGRPQTHPQAQQIARGNLSLSTGFPQGLANRENRENDFGEGKVRELSGNNFYSKKSGKSQGILGPKSLIYNYFIKQNMAVAFIQNMLKVFVRPIARCSFLKLRTRWTWWSILSWNWCIFMPPNDIFMKVDFSDSW